MSAGSGLRGRPNAGRPATGGPGIGLGGGGMGTLVTALEGGTADIRPPPSGRRRRRTPFPPAHKNTAFPPSRIPPTALAGASSTAPRSRRPPGRQRSGPFSSARCHPEGAPAGVPRTRSTACARPKDLYVDTPRAPGRDLTADGRPGRFPSVRCHPEGAPAGCRGRDLPPARDRRICTSTPPALPVATSPADGRIRPNLWSAQHTDSSVGAQPWRGMQVRRGASLRMTASRRRPPAEACPRRAGAAPPSE
jgi:hypothetical protein